MATLKLIEILWIVSYGIFFVTLTIWLVDITSADNIYVTHGGDEDIAVCTNELIDCSIYGDTATSSNNVTVTTQTEDGGVLNISEYDISFICGLFKPFIDEHENSTGGISYNYTEFISYKQNFSTIIPAFLGDATIRYIIDNQCKETPKPNIINKDFPWLWIIILLSCFMFISAYYVRKNALFTRLLVWYNEQKRKPKNSNVDEHGIEKAPKLIPSKPIN